MKTKLLSLLVAAGVFSLSASAQTYFLQEEFSSGVPGTWSQTTSASDGGWLGGDATSLSSSSFDIPAHGSFVATNDDDCNCDKYFDHLVSPVIDLSGATSAILRFDLFYLDGSYQGIQEEGHLEMNVDGNWTALAEFSGSADWQDGYFVDVSSAAGSSTVQFAWLYTDNDGWTYGMALDNVEVFEPAPTDVELVSLSLPAFAAPGNINIAGTITNNGSSTLNDVTIDWTDGTNSGSENLTGLGLEFGETYNFVHSDPLVGAAGTTYNIDVTVTTSGDANTSNNTLSGEVVVATQLGTRLTLVEDFTSSTCPPCEWLSNNGYGGNGINAGLAALNANDQNTAQVSVVKYPVNWPGNGDHAWNSEVETRRAYYGVTGAPTPVADGTQYSFNTFNASDVASHQDDVAVVDISATHTVTSDNEITVDVVVDPYVNLNARLYIALVEKKYDKTSDASFSNGETEFHHIFRKMLPSANGASVNLTAGTQYTNQQSYTATVNPNLPSQGSFDFHAGVEFEVVVFLQSSDNVVHNSAISTGTSQLTGLTDYDNNTAIGVYPNPVSNDQLTVVLETETKEDAVLTITDIKGAVVLSEAFGKFAAGVNKRTVDVSALKNGIYNVNVLANGHMHSKRVVVQK